MGTSRSGSVGSSPQWKTTRDELQVIAEALAGLPISIPVGPKGTGKTKEPIRSATPRTRSSKGGGGSSGGGVVGGGEGAAGKLVVGISTPQKTGGTAQMRSPQSVRALGKRLIRVSSRDRRFSLALGDCAVKVALDELFAISAAATLRFRTQRDAPNLFKEYGVDTQKSVGVSLSKSLDRRFRKKVSEKCKESTDNTEKARLGMQQTLVEMLSPTGGPNALLKMSANQIHEALRKTNSMNIVRQFYGNYIYNGLKFLVSSNHAGIPQVAEDAVMRSLRSTYCDDVTKRLVSRAREKGWLASQIPDKVKDWQDLLVEEEKVHA